MFDYFHLPASYGQADVQTFNAQSISAWQQWRKPRGCSMSYILAIGAGGGGGGGCSGAVGTSRGGGGGGASGGVTRLLTPILFLPDYLYCNAPSGGAGGSAGLPGESGAVAVVSTRPDTIAQNILLKSAATSAGAGGGGSSAAAGTNGAAGTPYNSSGFGLFSSSVGAAGAMGGAPAGGVGGSITRVVNNFPLTGGAGGGGTASANFNAGSIISSNWFPSINPDNLNGGRGGDGFYCSTPLVSCGGSGGGTSRYGQAGNGGSAAPGSGGGGGGGGVIGGAGGSGGGAMLIIVSW